MAVNWQSHELDPHLMGGRFRVRLPPELRPLYELHKTGEFRRLTTLWWPLLLLANVSMTWYTWVVLWEGLGAADKLLYARGQAVVVSLLLLGIVFAHHPAGCRTAERWIPLPLGVIVATGGYCVTQFDSHGLAMNHIHLAALALVVGVYNLHLTPPAALKSAVLGAVGFVLFLKPQYADRNLLLLSHYVTTAVISLFGVVLREVRERKDFIQAVMLAHERQHVQTLNQQLEALAGRDPLTNLPNRRALEECLQREWDRARRLNSPLSALMIDVDHFKSFNDHLGHVEGDRCLISLAQGLAKAVQRPGDFVARFGGEEFIVVLPDTDERGAREVAERLILHIDQLGLPHPGSPSASHVTISVGGTSVFVPLACDSAVEVVLAADAALYEAKAQGRHRACIRTMAMSPALTPSQAA